MIPSEEAKPSDAPILVAMYVALAESPTRVVPVVVRTEERMAAVLPSIRRAVAEVDRLVPVRGVMPMQDVVRAAYSTSWVMMGLLIVLAVLAS